MDKHANTEPNTVVLVGQRPRQGGPQRLDEILRDLDLRPATVDGHEVDPETAAAIQVLRDAGFEPEIIGVEEPPLSMEPPALSGAAVTRY
jgi:hypothetical protein